MGMFAGCTGSVGIGGKGGEMLDICAAVFFINLKEALCAGEEHGW